MRLAEDLIEEEVQRIKGEILKWEANFIRKHARKPNKEDLKVNVMS